MKILPFVALFSVLIFTSSYVSSKIEKPTATEVKAAGTFKQFIVHRQGADVSLSWSVTASDVAEFTVERSYDGDFFEPVSTLPCSGTGTHRYKDAGVFPGTIWYRIKAVKTDDSAETSLTESVRIVKRG